MNDTPQPTPTASTNLLEAALVASLTRADVVEHQARVLEKLAGLDTSLKGIVALLQTVMEILEQQTPAPAVPIATYEQMYGPIAEETPAVPVEETPAPQPQPARSSRLRRWFLREGQP